MPEIVRLDVLAFANIRIWFCPHPGSSLDLHGKGGWSSLWKL